MPLRTVLESTDLATLVLRGVHPFTLLKLSMVNKRTRTLIDTLCANVFAQSSAFELRWCSHLRKTLLLEFDPRRQELFYEYTLLRSAEKLRFLSNVHLDIGRLVCMSVDFSVPVEYTRGATGADAAARSLGIDIVVTAWKVVKIVFQEQHHGPRSDSLHGESVGHLLDTRLATVRLEALRFTVRSRHRVEMPFAIVLLMCNVPVHNALSARERAVLRTCRMCMHCHQRPRVFESIDATCKHHRVLCRTCFMHLFVSEHSLRRTWRVSKDRLFEARQRFAVVHFVCVRVFGSTQRFHAVVLKLQLATALGARSWDDFLRENYIHPLPRSRTQHAGALRYKWAEGPCPAQGD